LLSDDKPTTDEKLTSFTSEKLASLTFSPFFEKPSLLYAHRAAYYALWGQPEQFEAIVKFCPEVLTSKVEIQGPHVEQTEPHGNIIKATPYQLLLREDDNYIRDKKGRTFLEMAKSYFPDPEIEKQQKEEWFKGWDETAHVKELQAEFDKVLKAFDDSNARIENELNKDTLLQKAIQYFKEYLKTAVYKAKKNCIPQLWDYSAQKYTTERWRAYGAYNSDKNRLISFQIYGAIDIKLGVWGMQVLHCGIGDILAGFNVFLRTDVSSYYTSSHSSGLHPGVNSFMSILGGTHSVGRAEERGRYTDWDINGTTDTDGYFSVLCKKTKAARHNTSITNRCLIM